MIFTKALNYEDVRKNLNTDDVIALISCSSCARVSGTGTDAQMRALALRLRAEGFTVTDGYSINTVCTPKVYQAKPSHEANTIITMACSAGLANVKRIFADKKVITTCFDVGLMEADTVTKTVKVAMPCDGQEENKDKRFKMFSGEEYFEPLVGKNVEVRK